MLERDWAKVVRRYARQGGWRAYHTRYSLGSDPGFPDLIMVRQVPGGGPLKGLAVELKNEKGKLTEDQMRWLGLFNGAEFVSDVWRPDDAELAFKTLVTPQNSRYPLVTGRKEWEK